MDILKELKDRGSFSNITSEEKFKKLKKGDKVYLGFDPTGPSLHLGNYVQMIILKRFEQAGFKPVAMIGGATGMIGDPSFKSSERVLLSEEDITNYSNAISEQLKSYGFEVINNIDFYKDMNIIDFLRDIGKQLNVAYMMSKDSVKSRIQTGLSFTEFSYQLLQGWDFKVLYEKGVKVQLGGSDQWGNITAGTEIIRKEFGENSEAVGITTELLTTSSGQKFGKSEGNALFLDEKYTPAFSIFQYLYNTPDEDVDKYLKWLTLLPLVEIKEIMEKHSKDPKQRYAQLQLAQVVIEDIYNKDKVNTCTSLSNKLYINNDFNFTKDELDELTLFLPTIEVSKDSSLVDTLVKIDIAPSNKKAMALISQGAISINGNVVEDLNQDIYDDKNYIIIKRGKRYFYLVKFI